MAHDRSAPLGFLEVFSISAGGMMSSGLFVLPALVYPQVGSWMLLSYALAGLLAAPAMLSMAELSSAMPRAGGAYFYIGRSLGGVFGYFAGVANWLTITLKGAFALMGVGVFLDLFVPLTSIWQAKAVALACVLLFLIFNLLGVKESTGVQNALVLLMVGILLFYIGRGVWSAQWSRLSWPSEGMGVQPILAVAGMVCVSFGGLTKVASVAHQVKDPGRTLPRAMFTAFLVVMMLYLLSLVATMLLLDGEELTSSYTPLSDAAAKAGGTWAKLLLSLAALLAFATTANAAILTAAQAPLAMARDGLLPALFGRTYGPHKTPAVNILVTSAVMAGIIVGLDLGMLVKAASTMMILLFILVNLALVVMRESQIISYRPIYVGRMYPLVPLFGMVSGVFLVMEMGNTPLLLCFGFFVLVSVGYLARKPQKRRESAMSSLLYRLAGAPIDLREMEGSEDTFFVQLVRRAVVLDIARPLDLDKLSHLLAAALSLRTDLAAPLLHRELLARGDIEGMAVTPFLAIPHVVLPHVGDALVLIRCQRPLSFTREFDRVCCVLGLVSSSKEHNLAALSSLARNVAQDSFEQQWIAASDEEELRYLLLGR